MISALCPPSLTRPTVSLDSVAFSNLNDPATLSKDFSQVCVCAGAHEDIRPPGNGVKGSRPLCALDMGTEPNSSPQQEQQAL